MLLVENVKHGVPYLHCLGMMQTLNGILSRLSIYICYKSTAWKRQEIHTTDV